MREKENCAKPLMRLIQDQGGETWAREGDPCPPAVEKVQGKSCPEARSLPHENRITNIPAEPERTTTVFASDVSDHWINQQVFQWFPGWHE